METIVKIFAGIVAVIFSDYFIKKNDKHYSQEVACNYLDFRSWYWFSDWFRISLDCRNHWGTFYYWSVDPITNFRNKEMSYMWKL